MFCLSFPFCFCFCFCFGFWLGWLCYCGVSVWFSCGFFSVEVCAAFDFTFALLPEPTNRRVPILAIFTFCASTLFILIARGFILFSIWCCTSSLGSGGVALLASSGSGGARSFTTFASRAGVTTFSSFTTSRGLRTFFSYIFPWLWGILVRMRGGPGTLVFPRAFSFISPLAAYIWLRPSFCCWVKGVVPLHLAAISMKP